MFLTVPRPISFLTKLMYNSTIKYSTLNKSNQLVRFASNFSFYLKHDNCIFLSQRFCDKMSKNQSIKSFFTAKTNLKKDENEVKIDEKKASPEPKLNKEESLGKTPKNETNKRQRKSSSELKSLSASAKKSKKNESDDEILIEEEKENKKKILDDSTESTKNNNNSDNSDFDSPVKSKKSLKKSNDSRRKLVIESSSEEEKSKSDEVKSNIQTKEKPKEKKQKAKKTSSKSKALKSDSEDEVMQLSEEDDDKQASPKEKSPKKKEKNTKEEIKIIDEEKTVKKETDEEEDKKEAEKKIKEESNEEIKAEIKEEKKTETKTSLFFSLKKASGASTSSSDYNPAKDGYHPIKDAFWAKNEPVPYKALAQTLFCMEKTSKRLELLSIVTNYYRSVLALSPKDLIPSMYFLTNKVAPDYEGLELGIGDTVLFKSLAEATGSTLQKLKTEFQQKGDIGLVAEANRCNQKLLFTPKKLTVSAVFNKLRDIASISGNAVNND
ncbi:DNA ligase 1 [Brachionus plicatilis]|uniref:DNA ligase 1 n=1 Tax=Brachionus plicatilis TaxID=10195 RepID=A0A3M7T400_BRAPC|nr:DNA ligase 1 [Brachionus plicatilis]